MSNIYTADSIASRYADSIASRYADWRFVKTDEPSVDSHSSSCEPTIESGVVRNRLMYDFKVSVFNVATVLTIAACALTIIHGSLAFASIAVLAYSIRSAFGDSINQTGCNEYIKSQSFVPVERAVAYLTGFDQGMNECIQITKRFLGIDVEWQPVNAQFLSFRLWMNLTPITERSSNSN